MQAAEFKVVTDFESNLKAGDRVIIRWTHSNRFFACSAVVAKLNRSTVKATIDKPVFLGTSDGWPAGSTITAPLLLGTLTRNNRWSVNNRVEPEGGYQPVVDAH